MFFMKKNQKKNQNSELQRAQVLELQIMREQSKAKIKLLQSEIDELIQRGTTADQLNTKLLMLDYEDKQAQLADETAHLEEICKLITQLNGVSMVYQRMEAAGKIATVAETIDTKAIIADTDRANARQAILKEESDELDEVLKESRAQVSPLTVNSDFEAKVRQAKAQKLVAMANDAIPSPAREAKAVSNTVTAS